MNVGEIITDNYKDILDWLLNGSGHLPIACFLNDVTEHLPSTKRYFKILYLFCGHKPLDDEYVISHWKEIENEMRKSKDFDKFITCYIEQTLSSIENDVKVKLNADKSISITFVGKEPPPPKYAKGEVVSVRQRYVSGDYYYFEGEIIDCVWDDELLTWQYDIQCSVIKRSCIERQIKKIINQNSKK